MRKSLGIILLCIPFIAVWEYWGMDLRSRVEPEEFACQRERRLSLGIRQFGAEFRILELDEDPVILLDRWFRTPDNPNHILEPGQEYPNRVGDKWYKATLFALSDDAVFVGRLPLKDGTRLKEVLGFVSYRGSLLRVPEAERRAQPYNSLLIKTLDPQDLNLPFISDGKRRILWLYRVHLSLSPECERKERPMVGGPVSRRPMPTILYVYTNAPDPNNIHSVKFFRMWKEMRDKAIPWILDRPEPFDPEYPDVIGSATLRAIERIREYLPRLAIIPEEMEKAIAELEAKEAADKAKQEEGAAAASNKAPETPAGNPK